VRKAVLDTNVLVSGLVTSTGSSAPREVLRLMSDGAFTNYTSSDLLEELAAVLARPKFDRMLTEAGLTPLDVVRTVASCSQVLQSKPLPHPVVEQDPEDDFVLACAFAAGADAIVTGDRHLLDLHEYEAIPILTPRQAAERFAKGKGER